MSGQTTAAPASRRSLPPWAIATTAAGAGSVVYATHLYLYHRLQHQPASFVEELAEAAVHFGAWAALVPLVLRLGRRWALLDRHWPSRLFLHVALGLIVAMAQLFLHTLLDQALIHGWQGMEVFGDAGRRFFVRTYYANVVIYLALVLTNDALAWARHRRERETELERHLTQAQLDALRQQLQPHFLFNALNAISTLIVEDPSAAQRMVARLADLLRHALDERNAAEVPLWRELEIAGSYLAIEQARFGDRLSIAVDVPSAAQHALVPGLLLQPLLENAVRHGIACRPGPGRIEVTARIDDRTLHLCVRDGGGVSRDDATSDILVQRPALHDVGNANGNRIGLGNVRARLRHLYGDAQRIDMIPGAGGTAVTVCLPFRVDVPATLEAAAAGASHR